MSKKVKSTLRRYKRRFRITIISLLLVSVFVVGIAFEKIINFAKTIEKIQSAIDINLFDAKENLYFENGVFKTEIPRKDDIIIAKFTAQKSLNSSFSVMRKNSVYKVQDVTGELELVSKIPSAKGVNQRLIFSSKFADLSEEKAIIHKNIIGKLYSENDIFDFKFQYGSIDAKQDVHIKDIEVVGKNSFLKANEVMTKDLLTTVYLMGNVIMKNETKQVKANKSIILMENNNVKQADFFEKSEFTEGVEYNLKSEKSRMFFENKILSRAEFETNVRFIDYVNETIVEGDFAEYNAGKEEIIIYDNVVISSKKNNLKIKANDFYYNQETKKGSFDKLTTKQNERLIIEVDI